MKKTSYIVIIILFSSLLISIKAHAKKIADIDKMYKDPFVLVDNEQFYVWDRSLRKVVIYSKKSFKKITEFGKRGEGPGEGCTKAVSYKDKLIIGATYNGFYFAVFDTEGTMWYEIKKEYKKRRVTESEKKRRINESKMHMGERRWNDYKLMYNIVFPDYYPAFDNFIVDNNKIYVFLFPEEKTEEVLILNLEGKLVEKKIIPAMKTTIIDWARFAIQDGKIYYLDENEEGDRWELHEVNIDGPMQ